MDSIQVTTIAGTNKKGSPSVDGIGENASFQAMKAICYSEWNGGVLIAEEDSNLIRCLYPGSDKRKAVFTLALSSTLIESGALPIKPLISIILDFAFASSTYDGIGRV